MRKKDKDPVIDDYENLKNEIIRDKLNDIFRDNPKEWIFELEDMGFTYYDDEDDSDEIEEQNAKPENRRQKDLVDYFEGKKKLSEELFELFSEETAAETPNYPLIRKYFRQANVNLKALIIFGLDHYPGRIDLLVDLAFFHEFENVLSLLIKYYARACVEQENLDTFTHLAQDFYFVTIPDGYEAYLELQKKFASGTNKRIIIDALIEAENDKKIIGPTFH